MADVTGFYTGASTGIRATFIILTSGIVEITPTIATSGIDGGELTLSAGEAYIIYSTPAANNKGSTG